MSTHPSNVAASESGAPALGSAAAPVKKLSLRARAIQGAGWVMLGYGASQGIRLVSSMVLTRLLFPEAFGIMTIVHVFMQGLNMFSDVGVGPSIIQNKRGDEAAFLNTAWTVQVCRGFMLWLCAIAIGIPVARFYGLPELRLLIPAAALTALVDGFNSTKLWTARRHLAMRRVTALNLATQVIDATVMIVWAWKWPSVWALVFGGVLGNLCNMAMSHVFLPGKPNRLQWDPSAAKELFSFGRWIFFTTLLTFLGAQLDRLMLGRLLRDQMALLGAFNIAYNLTDIPRRMAGLIAGQVLFPAVSRKMGMDRADLREKLLRNRRWVIFALALGLALMVGVGDLVLKVLFDRRYHEAAWLIPILAIGLWPRMLYNTIGPALLAAGKPSYIAWGNAGRILLVAGLLPPAFWAFGLGGAAGVIALSEMPIYLAVVVGLYRESLSPLRQDIVATIFFVAGTVVAGATRWAGGFGLPPMGPG